MIQVKMNEKRSNRLGRLGENEHRQMIFDLTEWLELYPDASFMLINCLPGSTESYPVARVSRNGTSLLWDIQNTELVQVGHGRCELIITQGDTIAKSIIFSTEVLEALDGSGVAPEPWESWIEVFTGLRDETVEAAESIQNLEVASTTLDPGSSAVVEKTTNPETGNILLTFGIPKGDTGATGPQIDSLDATKIVNGVAIIDAVGIPVYVDDVSQYSEYGLTEKGWYLFAQIKTPDERPVTADTHVYGAKAIIPVGLDYIKVAVRFPVAALSQTVDVEWGDLAETFIFRATDLAIRNLDSRITFYIYDISPFATWTYVLTTDTTFAANKNYYTESGGVYALAEVTVGEAVPANTYYNHSKLHFEGMTRNVTYRLDEVVDCPIEIALPEVEDDGYGAWFEIQMRYNASYSCTLLPPTGVKIGTAQTQAQTAGINTIDLQYTDVDDVKMWTLLNTHSNIPTT